MAGKSVDIHSVPFFWTAIAGKNLRFAGVLTETFNVFLAYSVSTGYNTGHDDVIIEGDIDSYKFMAFYTK
jgi:hypothetical protein